MNKSGIYLKIPQKKSDRLNKHWHSHENNLKPARTPKKSTITEIDSQKVT